MYALPISLHKRFQLTRAVLTWISLLIAHICFIRARKAQGVPDSSIPYKAPLGINGSYVALFFCVLIAFTRSFNVFIHDSEYGNFDYKTFITAYLGIPVYVTAFFAWKFIKKTELIKPHNADIWTGKAAIDREEEEFVARKAVEDLHARGWKKFYNRFLSWLF